MSEPRTAAGWEWLGHSCDAEQLGRIRERVDAALRQLDRWQAFGAPQDECVECSATDPAECDEGEPHGRWLDEDDYAALRTLLAALREQP